MTTTSDARMRTFSEPPVTVVTPVYNGEPYIAECIESVLAQTYRNFEYIVVNNRSTDSTRETVQHYARRDARVRVHDNAEFLDIVANHNLAFRQVSAQSAYCKVVSADDVLLPDCIRQMVDLAELHPNVGIVSSYQMSDRKINNFGMPYPESVVSGREICRRSLLGGPYVFGAPTSLLYRASLVRSVPAFFSSPQSYADTAACYDYLDRCDFGFVHQILSVERVHTGQTSEISRTNNYYAADNLRFLVEFGPRYLSEDEIRQRLEQRLKSYYQFLGKAWLQRRGKEFWDYHESALQGCGRPLERTRLALSALDHVLNKILNPRQTIENLFAR